MYQCIDKRRYVVKWRERGADVAGSDSPTRLIEPCLRVSAPGVRPTDKADRAGSEGQRVPGVRVRDTARAATGARSGGAPQASAESSRERSVAAVIAFRNAARTPERSSSWIARVVVPPGEVT